MIETYFFIPADKTRFISKTYEVKSDYYILDLEDSVSAKNKKIALKNIMDLELSDKFFVRVPFFDKSLTENDLEAIVNKSNGRLVIPKVKSINDIEKVLSYSPEINFEIIVLVESPTGALIIENILKKYSQFIHGVGFGSHDYCATTGSKHVLEQLSFIKQFLVFYSKAYQVKYIDGVDLNLRDFSEFIRECKFVYDAGGEGKFIIHPEQLNILKDIKFLDKEEMDHLELVYNKLSQIPTDEMDIIQFDGKVYEKPHVDRIKRIFETMKYR